MFLGQIGVETILEDACRLAVERFGLKMAWVGLVVEGDYNVHPTAAYGIEEGYLRSIRVTWDDSSTGRGPTGTAIRTAQAVPMNRIETDPEEGFEVVLVNAQHVKKVPGRKTDASDAEWLADRPY